ncbi:hypothetical protein ARAM_000381 [Aspergillus rambellii]|uniref:RNA ligase/cyclic nucleotide phosphodiesterase n=1 Tax=Aspergillus rambellii TaxID=308745 RepID=A0A0F8V4U8_9EURO|nr:hypothetical protein ARAM_000381 [Aspergillus rambellii]
MADSARPALFSFPPQQTGEPSTRNWYQELLDHPDCQNDPTKIQEAYESFRSASLSRSIASFLPVNSNGTTCNDQNEKHPQPMQCITPDQALIRYLKLQQESKENGKEIGELSQQDVNCFVVWARPDTRTIKLLEEIQNRLWNLVGPDIHLIPPSDLHLSVLELSHRHSVSHLRSVSSKIGVPVLEKLLDIPRSNFHRDKSTARLVKPMVMFDKLGVAVGFVPADDRYTHHHLRNQLHTMALETGVSIDTCYTAPLAHVTVGRFINNAFFEGAGPDSSKEEVKRDRMAQWVNLIRQMNEDLKRDYGDDFAWVVGGERPLEVQLGYIKFGRGADQADLVGNVLGT